MTTLRSSDGGGAPRSFAVSEIAALELKRGSSVPLYRQLYAGLRDALLEGRLQPRTRLPATRTLAAQLGVSRMTVLLAFEQLLTEGYVEGRAGSGTYIASALPDTLLSAEQPQRGEATASRASPELRRGPAALRAPGVLVRSHGPPRPFVAGLAAIDAFPRETFARLAARQWRMAPAELFGYGDAAGYRPLREAIAAYLGAARAVRCTPEQVIVLGGSQQALSLAARLLVEPGEPVWIEDPGYIGARQAFAAAGARPVSVPIDASGLDVAAGARLAQGTRLAYVTPSWQFPLGITMSLERRLELLEWARQAGAWVIEDDYNSEYRYTGRPLAALQALDRDGRVIYTGSFSKVLLPGLRLGYAVLPHELVQPFLTLRALSDRQSPAVDQAVLAEFIAAGHFERHIRRMRRLYAERQAALLAAARRHLAGLLEVSPAAAGMHLLGWLPAGVDDRAVAHVAAAEGVDVTPLSTFADAAQPRGALLLGYTSVTPEQIEDGARRLAVALRRLAVGVDRAEGRPDRAATR